MARQLLQTTVTVRISTPRTDPKATPSGQATATTTASGVVISGQTSPANGPGPPNANKAPISSAPSSSAPTSSALIGGDTVVLASGVSLGKGLIVTVCDAAQEARFRVTLPNGQQAEAELRVIDDYGGLRLLETSVRDLPGLSLAAELPAVGGVVLTAAASGIEKPVVSQGIVGGVDRSLGSAGLPPVIQSDVRTTETSVGAALVNAQSQLVGIVVATASRATGDGWTYAVPVKHVQRVLSAKADDRIIILRRQRPALGLTLGPGTKEGSVLVERVEPGGPAEKAGIRVGDLVLEADGRHLRSAYQAVDLVLRRQPGDTLSLLVEQAGKPRRVDIELGGSTARPAEVNVVGTVRVGPQLQVRVVGPDQIEVVRNLAQPLNATAPGAQQVGELNSASYGGAVRLPRDEASLLRAQLTAFEKVIANLQLELKQRDAEQARTNELIRALTDELAALRRKLDATPNTPSAQTSNR